MKTAEHGIEDGWDAENVHHMRLMALLKELVWKLGNDSAEARFTGPQRSQESVNNVYAIRNLPWAGAFPHLSVCRFKDAPVREGLWNAPLPCCRWGVRRNGVGLENPSGVIS